MLKISEIQIYSEVVHHKYQLPWSRDMLSATSLCHKILVCIQLYFEITSSNKQTLMLTRNSHSGQTPMTRPEEFFIR